MHREESKLLAKKIIKFEEITKKTGEYQKKLEDEVKSLRQQLKSKCELEELLKLEITATKRNLNSIQKAYQKLNHEHLTLLDKQRRGKSKKLELSKSLRNIESKLFEEQIDKKNMTNYFSEEVNDLKNQLNQKDWINDLNYRNLQHIREELAEQLKIAKSSEVNLRRSLEKLQQDFTEKEIILKGYDERFRLAEESLTLFYLTVKNKEEELKSEKVKTKEFEAKENQLMGIIRSLQQELKSLKHEREEFEVRKRRENMLSRHSSSTAL